MTRRAKRPTVSYWAISVLSSRTVQVNAILFFVAVLSATEVVAIVPARWGPVFNAVVAVANIGLRFLSVRPIALIRPGTSKAVAVRMLGGEQGPSALAG